MITFANLFSFTSHGDGTARLEFKAASPTPDAQPTVVSIVYMTKTDAKALGDMLVEVLTKEAGQAKKSH